MVNTFRKPKGISRKCWICVFCIFAVVILLFLAIFVVLPFIFKYSVAFQRSIIFPIRALDDSDDFNNLEKYGINGGRNLYVVVNGQENITLGVWHLLPEDLMKNENQNSSYNFETLLYNSSYDIILYLHGNSNFRSDNTGTYKVLRKYFHVIACDYRGFADSSKAELNKFGIVNDTVELYKWIRRQTSKNVYIWGHSMGTGVATEAGALLHDEKVELEGLILEAPFTSVTDVVRDSPVGKVFSWLPWFEVTIIEPLEYNGLNFNSSYYIQRIFSPIMILHARDDTVIPYKFSDKLYEIAHYTRHSSAGNISYHLLHADGYDHQYIYKDPDLPQYIQDFIEECTIYRNS